jgi:hypothetical protein
VTFGQFKEDLDNAKKFWYHQGVLSAAMSTRTQETQDEYLVESLIGTPDDPLSTAAAPDTTHHFFSGEASVIWTAVYRWAPQQHPTLRITSLVERQASSEQQFTAFHFIRGYDLSNHFQVQFCILDVNEDFVGVWV